MRIAIVGANSFLSQALLGELVPHHEVIQVYHKNKGRLSPELPQLQINAFLEQQPVVDCIFYIASCISFKEDIVSMNSIFSTNILVLKNISETFQNAKIIHASSVSVYDNAVNELTEKSRVNPKSSYGMSKLWAEMLVGHHQGGGINIRISSLFGEGMNAGTFLPIVIKKAITERKVSLFGDGSRQQNYCYVRDAAHILAEAIDLEPTLPLLAVGSKSYSNLEVVEMLRDIFSEVRIVYEGEDTSPSFFYNNTLTRMLLDIPVTHDNFKEQLRKTALWMQKQY